MFQQPRECHRQRSNLKDPSLLIEIHKDSLSNPEQQVRLLNKELVFSLKQSAFLEQFPLSEDEIISHTVDPGICHKQQGHHGLMGRDNFALLQVHVKNVQLPMASSKDEVFPSHLNVHHRQFASRIIGFQYLAGVQIHLQNCAGLSAQEDNSVLGGETANGVFEFNIDLPAVLRPFDRGSQDASEGSHKHEIDLHPVVDPFDRHQAPVEVGDVALQFKRVTRHQDVLLEDGVLGKERQGHVGNGFLFLLAVVDYHFHAFEGL